MSDMKTGCDPARWHAYLEILNESLEEGHKMLCSSDVAWHGFLEQIFRQGYGKGKHSWLAKEKPVGGVQY